MEASIVELKKFWDLMESIPDPEIPVISIVDLGIVRSVVVEEKATIVYITPTYSGCPAIELIRWNIKAVLDKNGYKNIEIRNQLSPAWTTDWISDSGKMKLKAYGIAPPTPTRQTCNNELFARHVAVQCPRCNSYHSRLISNFGSTPCKSMHQCMDCLEPFEAFKCH
jgi:ring-1,2-phenylacetyl-CoA epoxidase subunit PaaD